MSHHQPETLSRNARSRNGIRRNGERGIVMVWMAILLTVLVAFVGLACDWAHMLLVVHQLQNAADAAALAGGTLVRTNEADARTWAVDVAAANTAGRAIVQLDRNDANDEAGDVVLGTFDRSTGEFTPGTGSPNAVKVVARRTTDSLNGPLPLLFAPIYGVESSELARHAIAFAGGQKDAGIIVLNPAANCAYDIGGNFTLNVPNGVIHVNSEHESGACANGNPVMNVDSLDVSGGYRPVGNPTVSGGVDEGAPQVEDPLAELPEPTNLLPIQLSPNVKNGETLTIQPGFYPAGISHNNGTLNLTPGVYILDGIGLNVSGNSNFNAPGSLLFIRGTGAVDITGTGDINITPPDPDNPDPAYQYPDAVTYEGVSIFQSRTDGRNARITGTSLMNLEGTLYFPVALLNMRGTSTTFANQVIADRVSVQGTGTITINYDGRFPVTGRQSFLVE